MRRSEEGAVWSDESACSDGDGARVQEGAVEVDVDALTNSGAIYVLVGGALKGRKGEDTLRIGAIVDFNGTVYPCIVVEELIILLLRGCFGGEGGFIAKDTRIWLIQTRHHPAPSELVLTGME
jgi:hypothetical protein